MLKFWEACRLPLVYSRGLRMLWCGALNSSSIAEDTALTDILCKCLAICRFLSTEREELIYIKNVSLFGDIWWGVAGSSKCGEQTFLILWDYSQWGSLDDVSLTPLQLYIWVTRGAVRADSGVLVIPRYGARSFEHSLTTSYVRTRKGRLWSWQTSVIFGSSCVP